MRNLPRLIATFFFIGYFPYIPGTIASLAALGIFLIFRTTPVVVFALSGLLVILGFYFSEKAELDFRKKDPKQVVIDEVAGMMLCFVLLPVEKMYGWALFFVFLLFRIFDWTKPYPLRKIQYLKGSLGIMLDDVLAAVYTVIIFQIFFKIAS